MWLWVTHEQARAIEAHARAQAPNEACGLISGHNGQALEVVSVDNVSTTPQTHFEMDPAQQVTAMTRFYHEGRDLLAIYHSHPNTAPIPSQTDIRSAAYPNTIYLIISLQHSTPQLQAWYINGPDVRPVPLHIGSTRPDSVPDAPLSPAQKTAIILSTLMAFVILIIYSITLLPPAPIIPGG